MAYNPIQKLNDNLEAIRIAFRYQKAGGPVISDDLAALRKYAGFGGLKAVLYGAGSVEDWRGLGASESDLKLHAGIQELHNILKMELSEKDYKEQIDFLKNSVLTAFYTP